VQKFREAVYCRVWAFAVFVLLLSSSVKAQAPIYHPGDVIKIAVTFDGPDAGKISLAQISLSVPKLSQGQEGFKTDIFPGESKQAGQNTFEVSYKIPENQASGEYQLGQIRATISQEAPITFFYNAPADFQPKTFTIDNPKTVIKPAIKDVKVP
jgi:hypothetical protein